MIRFWRKKSPEHDFRYLYSTVSKICIFDLYLPVREHTSLIWSGGLKWMLTELEMDVDVKTLGREKIAAQLISC